MSKHQVDPDHQMSEFAHLTNPEGHATVPTDLFAIRGPALEPVEDRPIELVYNNKNPYALAELKIFGKVLNPENYTIDAKKGLITLSYHYFKVNVTVSNEELSE